MSNDDFAQNFLDGFPVLDKRTQATLRATKQLGSFFAKASEFQKEYMKNISSLCAQYKAKKLPLFDGSVQTGIASMVNELENVALAQKDFVEQLLQLKKDTENFVKEKEKRQKQLVANYVKISSDWRKQVDTLKRTRATYVSAAKDANSLQQQLQKKEADTTVKSSVLSAMTTKSAQAAEKAKAAEKAYQEMLQQTNDKQSIHYEQEQPALLKEFQQFEEDRVNFVKDLLDRYAGFLDAIKMPDKWETSFKVVTSAVASISPTDDIADFTEKNKTGVTVPQTMPFEGWDGSSNTFSGTAVPSSSTSPSPSSGGSSVNLSSSFSSSSKPTTAAVKPAGGSGGATRTYGLTAADQGLSNSAKTSKLKEELEAIEKAIQAETNQLQAVERLIQFYAKDPAGKKTAEAQQADVQARIEKLKQNKQQMENQLSELQGGGGDDGGDAGGDAGGAAGGEAAEGEKGKMLYDYDASNESELSVKEGEIVHITEKDASGWWYATVGDRQGFVPANYVELC